MTKPNSNILNEEDFKFIYERLRRRIIDGDERESALDDLEAISRHVKGLTHLIRSVRYVGFSPHEDN